jgi:uncharacterized protein YbjQ (UPF0145 family)
MEDMIGLLIPLAIFGGMICLGLFVGGTIERNHFKNLDARDAQTSHIIVTQLKSFPNADFAVDRPPTILISEVVISSDYLKSFLGGLRNIFGGEVKSFQTLLERARREALLRIKEESIQLGYDAICNVRMETADIGGRASNKKNKIIMASILISGTAYSSNRISR